MSLSQNREICHSIQEEVQWWIEWNNTKPQNEQCHSDVSCCEIKFVISFPHLVGFSIDKACPQLLTIYTFAFLLSRLITFAPDVSQIYRNEEENAWFGTQLYIQQKHHKCPIWIPTLNRSQNKCLHLIYVGSQINCVLQGVTISMHVQYALKDFGYIF